MAAYTTFKLFLLTTLLALTMPFLATSAQPLNPNLIQLNSNLVARLTWVTAAVKPFRPLSISVGLPYLAR
ncbi:unnamed protein product [Prunus armeniaca]|uniref:Uncharacterized protein n=1 Tax=Prunus armeniaca TaxID=36596 RepID=A0A6J5Y081_PRUAR|nr:unnamed protein product [Prunus armeniaca]CAB4319530.1 unnamed protein product [Prunus armeniaca]